MKTNKIRPGARVEVTRIDGEKRQGYAIEQVETLRHIGEFWLIGTMEPVEAQQEQTGTRKPRKRPKYHPFGMYAPEDIRVLAGAPRRM